MPAASRTCFGTAAVIDDNDDDDDDDDGPALELIGLVCMTISEMLLRIGMAAVSNDPSDPKNDIHDAAYDMIAESGDCRPDLRASSHTRELRRDDSVSWTRYVDGMHTLGRVGVDSNDLELPSCVAAVSASAGTMAFSPLLPFKSLSLSLDDYRFSHEMMSALYVPISNFSNLITSGRNGLNRPMMELVAAKYAKERHCTF